MNARRKSDERVVPKTSANNDGKTEPAAESIEERRSARRNIGRPTLHRTPKPEQRRSRGLHGVRDTAKRCRDLRFTNLLHHITFELLEESFYKLRKNAARGVDGVSWHDYETDLEDRLVDLHGRIHRGAFRAKPSKRVYIEKSDGRKRPLGIPSLEDKIVQHAVRTVLECIYEEDFLGFSYGFRPRRSQHQALDALAVGIDEQRVNWILDADIEGFFDPSSWYPARQPIPGLKFSDCFAKLSDRFRCVREQVAPGLDVFAGFYRPGPEAIVNPLT